VLYYHVRKHKKPAGRQSKEERVMKKDILFIVLIGVLFVLVAGSIVASFSFYKEYKDKMDYLEQQTMSGKSKVESLEAKLDNFKSTVDDINAQIKSYNDSIKAIQNTVTLSEDERKSLMSKLEEMKKDLQGWQKDYSSTVIDIRQGMMALKDDLDSMGSKPKEVELGKITVKQGQKDEKKSEGLNFKSGNVRKVGA
jgi:chromosome segregation ATPase